MTIRSARRTRVLLLAASSVVCASVFAAGEGGSWSVVPMRGQSQFVFACAAPPEDYAGLVASLNLVKQLQLGNGVDVFYGPETYTEQLYEYIAQLNWQIVAWHETSGSPAAGAYVPGNPSMTDVQKAVLAITDKPGAPTPVHFGEWDNAFHNLLAINGNNGYTPIPTTKQQAYNELKAYYTERNATYDGRLMSVTGGSAYEPYAAEWGTQCIGMELGENIPNSQTMMAFGRGASRQWDTPWSMQFSPWYQGCLTTTGPLTGGPGTARGADGGHSQSLFQRFWYHAWFAGAAMVTPENGDGYLYQPSSTAAFGLTTLGVAANNYYKFTLSHDRGVPYTPLAVVLDHYAGYSTLQGGNQTGPWAILPRDSGDQQIDDLFKYQLYPGSVPTNVNSESCYLVPTPYGEMEDVLLSSASANTLAKYPEILLTGDITFDSGFVSQLRSALLSGSRVLMSKAQANALGSVNLAILQSAGSVEILSSFTNPATGRVAAISNTRLAQISSDHMPIAVSGSPVGYEINKNSLGWLVELINNDGVTKLPWAAAVVDPSKAASVSLQARFDNTGYFAVDWDNNSVVPLTGNVWNISVGPGATKYIQIALNQWQTKGGGNWSQSQNWLAQVPNSVDSTANFLGAISSDTTITLNSAAIVGKVVFDNDHRYTINRPSTMFISTTSGPATINLRHGDHSILAPLNLTVSTNIIGTGALTAGNIINSGSLNIQTTVNAGNISGSGTTSVAASENLTTSYIRQSGLDIGAAGSASIRPNGSAAGVSRVQALSIVSGGKLDITYNAIVVDYTGVSPLSTIAGQIKSGYAGGSWAGFGITSSSAAAHVSDSHPMALGFAEASALGVNSFCGQSNINNAVLVRYTLSGDANLDSVVNALDFNLLATNFGKSTTNWLNGDFNFDGAVNSADFVAMASNFNFVLPTASPGLGTVVPENSSCLATLCVIILLTQSRVRRGMSSSDQPRLV